MLRRFRDDFMRAKRSLARDVPYVVLTLVFTALEFELKRKEVLRVKVQAGPRRVGLYTNQQGNQIIAPPTVADR